MSDIVDGSEFAGYRIGQVVGRGGMGVVHRALDLSLQRPVAIKLIADELALDPGLRERFKREARLMAAIDHPNVIPVYAAGEQDGHLFLVMRYVDGTDLQRVLNKRGQLPAAEAIRIVDQVGRALDAAHQRGLVHRDIKPANVLLDGEHVYLTDFGITRLIDQRTRSTDTGKWVGTLDYMAPEHLRGEATDGLSDVYSLACLLYACLTGSAPFHRDTPAATITAQLHEAAPKVSKVVDVPKQLDSVIARGLAKRPKDRYPTAEALASAARAAVQAGEPKAPLFRRRAQTGSGVETSDHASVPAEPAFTAPRGADGRRTRIAAPTSETVVVGDEATGVAATQVARTAVLGSAPPRQREAQTTAGPALRRRRVVWSTAGVLVLAVIAAVVIVAANRTTAAPGPLTVSEIKAALSRFSVDYSNRNGRDLGRLLASDVTRVDPFKVQHGRAAVLDEYRQQFKTKPVTASYVLSDLTVTPGWAGRAQGNYKLTLKNGGTLNGDVVFGLQRAGKGVQIALIATR